MTRTGTLAFLLASALGGAGGIVLGQMLADALL